MNANQRKRLTRWSQKAQDMAPAVGNLTGMHCQETRWKAPPYGCEPWKLGTESPPAALCGEGPSTEEAPAAPAVRPRRAGTGLPVRLQAGLQRLSGVDVSATRVHYNSPEPARVRTR